MENDTLGKELSSNSLELKDVLKVFIKYGYSTNYKGQSAVFLDTLYVCSCIVCIEFCSSLLVYTNKIFKLTQNHCILFISQPNVWHSTSKYLTNTLRR